MKITAGNKDLRDELWNTLNIRCGGYNSSIDKLLLEYLEIQYKNTVGETHEHWYADIANKLDIPKEFSELIKYMFSSAKYIDDDIMEYGSSPRGAWLTKRGEEFYLRMKPLLDELRA